MSDTVMIRIARCSDIVESRDVAIIKLNSFEHIVGQPIMIRFYEGEVINSIVAIGIKNGVGHDCYKIVSTHTNLIVNGFLNELPDVSTIINGEKVYVVKLDGVWNIVYFNEGQRDFQPVTEGPFVVYDTSCNLNWYFVDGEFKREDDFVTVEENKKNLEKSLNQVKNPSLSIVYSGQVCYEIGTTLESPEFTVYVNDYSGKDITDEVIIKAFSDKTLPNLTLTPRDHKITTPGFFTETDTLYFTAEYSKDDFVVHSETEKLIFYFNYPIYHAALSDIETIREPEDNEKLIWNGLGKLEMPSLELNNSYDIIWIPSDIKIDNITDLSETTTTSDYTKENITLNGVSYKLYVRENPETIENLSVVLISKEGLETLISSSDKNAVLNEIRTTIKPEIKAEVWDEVKSNLKSEIKSETTAEVLFELKQTVRDEVSEQLGDDIKGDIIEEIKPEITEQLKTELTSSIIESIKTEILETLSPELITKEEYDALVESGEVVEDKTYYIYDPEEDID